MQKIKSFIKKESVLCIAAFCAVVSMFFIPPDPAYIGYIDLRVLCLLFCLMAAVLGLESCGIFDRLARILLARCRSMPAVALALVLLPFFTSMLVTNDVALITFVPFALLVLELLEKRSHAIWIIVLQTIAANLGSMATPVGNPQNLFLFGCYELSAGEFFGTVLPPAVFSFIILVACCLLMRKEKVHMQIASNSSPSRPWRLWIYLGLFLLCLLSVFRVLHYGLLSGIVLLVFLLLDRQLLKKVDYSLLFTFVCFFIFAGNLGRIPQIHDLLSSLLGKNALLSSVLASQVISNVPAAVLLSGFTDNWNELLLGVNIGGLGTPIASLASLISLKLYSRSTGAQAARYMAVFLAANLAGLSLLLILAVFL